MHNRLKQARREAGFPTAARAIRELGFNDSRDRAHENGQNRFNILDAKRYAVAYKVSASWLLLGGEYPMCETSFDNGEQKKIHDHDCLCQMEEAIKLLKEDRNNHALLQKLDACVQSLIGKMGV